MTSNHCVILISVITGGLLIPDAGNEDAVDSAQFHVDLETEV